MAQSYRELEVWQKAVDLSVLIYKWSEKLPKSELFGLSSQVKRAAVSIPSNIAEGRYRSTRKDFTQFLRIAYASGAELETQLEIARRLSFIDELDYNKINSLLAEIMKMLNVMISRLSEWLKAIS